MYRPDIFPLKKASTIRFGFPGKSTGILEYVSIQCINTIEASTVILSLLHTSVNVLSYYKG
jgi:hypothetical protein